ncbi:hypothetical protein PNOK_0472100 [Pyrrhoderma noxium]|uniref:Uncharacterized protein n=1 Tax=Pyrrhoderma noxium TaxID=2282107 RepID=A0A286UJL4_9AGAM|nr:hypothetical protein PNOK_0472100 [Pyrrhoderma noxium]
MVIVEVILAARVYHLWSHMIIVQVITSLAVVLCVTVAVVYAGILIGKLKGVHLASFLNETGCLASGHARSWPIFLPLFVYLSGPMCYYNTSGLETSKIREKCAGGVPFASRWCTFLCCGFLVHGEHSLKELRILQTPSFSTCFAIKFILRYTFYLRITSHSQYSLTCSGIRQ